MERTHFEYQLETINSVPVLHLSGEIDLYTAPAFKDAISDPVSQGHRHIVLDMNEVTFMDSSGFGALLSASKPLRLVSGSIHLAACNETITRMLEITRLNSIIPVYNTPADAIARITALESELVHSS